ncbi:MAG TPA: F0F1 ATP synthase subunit epsilon [Alphaproteobacteria bacterium]|nr:F0F1 ATP synthase subunit epsilon [Alphaproteobacteria bacterium]
MQLKIVTPAETFLEETVQKVVAEAPNGAFGLLPRHIDFVSELVPSVLVYQRAEEEEERFVALNTGTLVKCGDNVLISTRTAIRGDDLETLRSQIRETFLQIDEQERVARSALARLEAGMVRRFIDLEKAIS